MIAIHLPILAGYFDGVYVLHHTLHADLDAPDVLNVTALHIAAWNGDTYLVKYLLYHRADVYAVDKHRRTPLHYAGTHLEGPYLVPI